MYFHEQLHKEFYALSISIQLNVLQLFACLGKFGVVVNIITELANRKSKNNIEVCSAARFKISADISTGLTADIHQDIHVTGT